MTLINFLIGVTKLDWKPFALALIGFLCGVTSNSIGQHYGSFVGLADFMLGWWFILIALLWANKNDLPIWKIFK